MEFPKLTRVQIYGFVFLALPLMEFCTIQTVRDVESRRLSEPLYSSQEKLNQKWKDYQNSLREKNLESLTQH